MLAVLGLDFRTLQDLVDPGAPDEPDTVVVSEDDPFRVGEDSFWVQVRAWDERTADEADLRGVISLPVDIAWPDTTEIVMEFTGEVPDELPDEIAADNPVVTANFPDQRAVTTFQPGNILQLRGGTYPDSGSPIGDESTPDDSSPLDYAEFSLLAFDAVGAARAVPVRVIKSPLESMSFADAAELDNTPEFLGTIRIQAARSGTKFEDVDGDGVRDEGEQGLSGWEIRAYLDNDGSGTLTTGDTLAASTVTATQEQADADPDDLLTEAGDYVFWLDTGPRDLTDEESMGTAADYILVEVSKSGWDQTAPGDDVMGDSFDPGLGSFGHLTTVDVGDGNEDGFDFGNQHGLSSLSGFVYLDTDNDGIRLVDETTGVPIELGLPNVTISLYLGDETTPLQQVTTGPDGWYHFEDLEPGTYRIVESPQPDCFLDGQETLGVILPGEDPRGTVGEDEFTDVLLEGGDNGIDYNFGEVGERAGCITKLKLLASSPPPAQRVAAEMGLNREVVTGTSGDDDITVTIDGDVYQVTGLGDPIEFAVSEVDILAVDGGEGDDTVRVEVDGTDENDIAHLLPGSSVLRSSDNYTSSDYAVEVASASTEIDAGTGDDLTVMRDSPGDDELFAESDSAEIRWSDDIDELATALALDAADRVRAISVAGAESDDEATVNGPAYDFLLLGDWVEL